MDDVPPPSIQRPDAGHVQRMTAKYTLPGEFKGLHTPALRERP